MVHNVFNLIQIFLKSCSNQKTLKLYFIETHWNR